jgi:hypothetical protein
MAFTRPIPIPVCPCGAPAEVQVVDHYEPVGCFCNACGNREVQRRATEESRAIRGSEPPSSLAVYDRDAFQANGTSKEQLLGHD